jgi:hypothetical protein
MHTHNCRHLKSTRLPANLAGTGRRPPPPATRCCLSGKTHHPRRLILARRHVLPRWVVVHAAVAHVHAGLTGEFAAHIDAVCIPVHFVALVVWPELNHVAAGLLPGETRVAAPCEHRQQATPARHLGSSPLYSRELSGRLFLPVRSCISTMMPQPVQRWSAQKTKLGPARGPVGYDVR